MHLCHPIPKPQLGINQNPQTPNIERNAVCTKELCRQSDVVTGSSVDSEAMSDIRSQTTLSWLLVAEVLPGGLEGGHGRTNCETLDGSLGYSGFRRLGCLNGGSVVVGG